MAFPIRSTRLSRALGVLLVGALWVGSAVAQVRTERHPRLGLTVERSLAYERLPVPPRAERLVLLYVHEERTEGQVPATLEVHVLAADDPDGVRDTRAFVERVLRPERVEERAGAGTRHGHRGVVFDTLERGPDGQELRGRVVGWEGEGRCVVVHGVAEAQLAEQELARWRRFAETLTLEQPVDASRRAYEARRHYAARSLPDVPRRIAARLASPEDWLARDTPTHLFLLHGTDRELLVRMGDELEALRRAFERELPRPAAPPVTGVVRLCADRAEYLAYGGDPRAVGYFSPQEGELVLYHPGDERALLRTLRHEAFHQHVYHALGGVSPHPWFDEGLAEFYGGARVDGGRVEGYECFEDLSTLTREALRRGDASPLDSLLAMDRAAYYARPEVHYPQGWSLVTYLRTRAEGRSAELGARYFEALCAAWGRELTGLGDARSPALWNAARERARGQALQQALRGVDLPALERDWRAWASTR